MTLRLPNELLLKIFEQVSYRPDLLRVRAASRTFHTLASPLAFRVLRVTNTPKSAMELDELVHSPDVARLVQEIAFQENGEREWEKELDDDDEAALFSFHSSLSSLALIPHLRSLSFTFSVFTENYSFYDDGTPDAYLALQDQLLDALASNPFPHSSLRSFKLANVMPFAGASYASPGFAALMSSLHHLDVSVVLGYADDDPTSVLGPNRPFWEMFSTTVLRPATALRSLALKGIPPIDFGALVSPHLTSLTLCKVQFEDDIADRGADACVLRHASTLQSLTLLACPIQWSGTDAAPQRLWADIWDSFAKELGELTDFEVVFDEVHRRDGEWGEKKYGWFLSLGSGYMYVNKEVPGQERDRPALDALKDTVRERRQSRAQ